MMGVCSNYHGMKTTEITWFSKDKMKIRVVLSPNHGIWKPNTWIVNTNSTKYRLKLNFIMKMWKEQNKVVMQDHTIKWFWID